MATRIATCSGKPWRPAACSGKPWRPSTDCIPACGGCTGGAPAAIAVDYNLPNWLLNACVPPTGVCLDSMRFAPLTGFTGAAMAGTAILPQVPGGWAWPFAQQDPNACNYGAVIGTGHVTDYLGVGTDCTQPVICDSDVVIELRVVATNTLGIGGIAITALIYSLTNCYVSPASPGPFVAWAFLRSVSSLPVDCPGLLFANRNINNSLHGYCDSISNPFNFGGTVTLHAV